MIQSFGNKETERLWESESSVRFRAIRRVALRKLIQLNAAERIDDLRVPPGNQLEALQGKRKGTYSIRINRQWRICFRWTKAGPSMVEIVDYH
jgi:proteic killer suppression protein